MTNRFIIECPNCKVRFFVTDDLLSAAKGALRCGFCMHVFNGNEHVVYESLDNSKLLHAEEDNVSAEEIAEDKQQVIDNTTTKISYSEDYWHEVVNNLSNFSVDFNDAEKKVDDLLSVNTVATEEVQPIQKTLDDTISEVDLAVVDTDIVDYLEQIDFDERLQWTEQELIDNQSKDITEFIKETTPALDAQPKATDQQAIPDDIDEDDRSILVIGDTDDTPKDIYGNRLKKVSDVDFSLSTKPKIVNKHNLLWAMLSLVAVLALVGQYLRYAAPEMAKTVANRAWAEQICDYLWCKIPSLVDVDKIKTSQLLVRSNPEYDGVLNIDAIIRNDLTITQPFPVIELRFTDLNGQTVASRRFSPDEYLTNEALGKDQMPSNTPIYISLAIIDPGETAVGHSLYYYPAP